MGNCFWPAPICSFSLFIARQARRRRRTPSALPASRGRDNASANPGLPALIKISPLAQLATGRASRIVSTASFASALLFMALPGLALFYGGLVRRRNVLSVLAQCLGITGLVTIL